LKRGYAVIKGFPGGKMIRSISAVNKDETVEALLNDGSLIARVEEINRNKDTR